MIARCLLIILAFTIHGKFTSFKSRGCQHSFEYVKLRGGGGGKNLPYVEFAKNLKTLTKNDIFAAYVQRSLVIRRM